MQVKGRVIQAIKDNFLVSYKNEDFSCTASQKLRFNKNKIICGDIVEFSTIDKHITGIDKRKNSIIRPKVANVDKVFITISLKEPDLSTHLLDKMILFYAYHNIEPILVFTKANLTKENEYKEEMDEYITAGYDVIVSSLSQLEITQFASYIKDSTVIFAGQSGVGKSTILNMLNPELNITTNQISKVLNRGKHTTTKSTLYNLFGGYICDTPGFSSVEQLTTKPIDLARLFKDFALLSNDCKFNNCIHLNEINCAVKKAVEVTISKQRYNSYLKIINKVKGGK